MFSKCTCSGRRVRPILLLSFCKHEPNTTFYVFFFLLLVCNSGAFHSERPVGTMGWTM